MATAARVPVSHQSVDTTRSDDCCNAEKDSLEQKLHYLDLQRRACMEASLRFAAELEGFMAARSPPATIGNASVNHHRSSPASESQFGGRRTQSVSSQWAADMQHYECPRHSRHLRRSTKSSTATPRVRRHSGNARRHSTSVCDGVALHSDTAIC